MKHGEKLLICALAGLAFGLTAQAVTSDASGNPYQSIIERNVFGLKPPPPPPGPGDNNPPPAPIYLQGIYTFGGTKRALFKVMSMPAKGAEKARGEQSFNLAEGQRDGDIEVLEIDAKAGTVKVNEFGTITNLDFENNGIKGVAAAPPAPGMAPPRPGMFMPPPAASPFNPAAGASPTRPIRLPGPPGAAAARSVTPAYAGGASGYPGGSLGVSLSGSTPAQTQVGAAQSGQSQMSAEEKFLMIEAYRQRVKDLGLNVPPVPPTPLTAGFSSGNPTTGTTTPKATWPPRAPGLPLVPPAAQ